MKLSVSLAEVRKFAVAVLGVVVEALNAGLLSGTAARVAGVAIAAATAAGVFAVPNKPAPAPAPAAQPKAP